MPGRPRHPLASLLAALALLALVGLSARAQEPLPPQLLERLDRLEKQNEELRKALDSQRKRESVPAPAAETAAPKLAEKKPADPAAPKKADDKKAPPPDDETIQKAVDRYLKLKADADQKKAGDPNIQTFEVGKDLGMKGSWKDGPYFETADKAFTFHIGGRWDVDSTSYFSSHGARVSIGQFNTFTDPSYGLTDGVDFRRARLRLDATMWEFGEATVEYEFANYIDLRQRSLGISPAASNGTTGNDFDPAAPTRFTEVWAGFKDLPYLGLVKVGHQKELLTMSNATSARYMTFMERPMVFDAFNGDYQFMTGVASQKLYFDERMLVWAGVFRNNNIQTNANNNGAFDWGDGDYVYDLRVSGLPVWQDDGDLYVHLGAVYSYRNLHQDQTRFRAFPAVRSGTAFEVPSIVNSGTIFTRDAQQLANGEFGMAWGPWTVTSEWSASRLTNAYTGGLPTNGVTPSGVVRHGTYTAQGAYVEVLRFLTDDHRPYRRELGGYDRIRPREHFFLVPKSESYLFGRGAWEVGLRYDYLDLTSAGINGGISQAVTAGLNWHINANMRMMFNYIYQTRAFSPQNATSLQTADFNGVAMRMHWDF